MKTMEEQQQQQQQQQQHIAPAVEQPRRWKVTTGPTFLAAAAVALFMGAIAIFFATQSRAQPSRALMGQSRTAITSPGFFNTTPASTKPWGGVLGRLLLLMFIALALMRKGINLLFNGPANGARVGEEDQVLEGPAGLEEDNRPRAQEVAEREEAEEQEPLEEPRAEDEATPAGRRPLEDEEMDGDEGKNEGDHEERDGDKDENEDEDDTEASPEQQHELIREVAAAAPAALRSQETGDMEKASARRSSLYSIVLEENLCSEAAYNGDLPVLRLARARRCSWDERTCNLAAKAGHLEVLQWARGGECGECPWGEQTCQEAAWGGHLNVLTWVISSGCPWSKDACERVAEQNGNHHVLEWIRATEAEN